jgi:hypothetical protein
VLTTVDHLSKSVIELTLRDETGQKETLRPTSTHKFYSVTRNEWLSASDLQTGEHLDGVDGTVTVDGVSTIPGTHRIYNMTVQDEHLYRVSGLGVLVHNECRGYHHFFPKFMGNLIGYGKKNLQGTFVTRILSKRDHSAIHKKLRKYLNNLNKRTKGGLDLRPHHGAENLAQKYPVGVRFGVMEGFFRKNYGKDHSYYKQFVEEFQRASQAGKVRL